MDKSSPEFAAGKRTIESDLRGASSLSFAKLGYSLTIEVIRFYTLIGRKRRETNGDQTNAIVKYTGMASIL